MERMLNMTQTEVSYWVAFLKDIKERENGKPKPPSGKRIVSK